jgi:hypothetical protein
MARWEGGVPRELRQDNRSGKQGKRCARKLNLLTAQVLKVTASCNSWPQPLCGKYGQLLF